MTSSDQICINSSKINSSFIIYHSPINYVYCANNPVMFVDPDGKNYAYGCNSDGAGGNGHVTLYFQTKYGEWVSFDQGAMIDNKGRLEYPIIGKISSIIPMLLGFKAKTSIEIHMIAKLPDDVIEFNTNPEQDDLIMKTAYEIQKKQNGKFTYSIFSNSCTDSAVDVINESKTEQSIPNPSFVIKPNSWFDFLKNWKNDNETTTKARE